MAAYGYARVSTLDQDLTVQRRALRAAGCSVIRAEKKSGNRRDGRTELQVLEETWRGAPYAKAGIEAEVIALLEVNERLWVIEDGIRDKERANEFDADFIRLARAVYFENDERAAIKRRINTKLGSELVEEKSYAEYKT